MNILIAEDNQQLQALNSEWMSFWGFGFDIAANGFEAIEYARMNEGKYDLGIMDVEMPNPQKLIHSEFSA